MANRQPLDSVSPTTQLDADQEPTQTSRRDLLRGAVSIVAGASVPVSTASAMEVAPVIAASPTAKAAWQTFEVALADALAALDEDEFLIVSCKRVNRFVQFLDQGAHGIRMETVSNVYLRDGDRLSGSARRRLPALGWHEPTIGSDEGEGPSSTDIDGSSNYFRDAPPPVPYAVLARIAAATFREVFGMGHPGELEYDAGSVDDGGVSLRFPALGLKRSKRAS
jgi:hypothetical protein